MSRFLPTHRFAFAVVALLLAQPAAAVTIGNDLVDRSLHDGASGSIFFAWEDAVSGSVGTWGFFDNDFAGREITPVIMKAVGNQYVITGIGTTRTSDGSGAQTHSFDVVSGDGNLGIGEVFGWKDGGNGTNNPGVPEYDNGGGETVTWHGGGQTSFATGDALNIAGNFGRTYSIMAEVEPGDGLVGNLLVNRGSNDGASGSIFVLDDPFADPGKLAEWSFYDNDTPGREITPLLLKQDGANWEIIGIGETQTSDGSGAQHFDFNLLAGSDHTGSGIYFGWKDGGNGSNNQGVADFDNNTGDPNIIWLGAGRTSFGVGDSYGVSGQFGRTYSIQAFALPEPTTAAFGLLGGVALGMRRRRAR